MCKLPYYIPLPVGIGTLGLDKIRQRIQGTRSLFDIGAVGPIAGFIVSLIINIGFLTLPGPYFLNEFGDHQALLITLTSLILPLAFFVGRTNSIYIWKNTPI